MPDSNIKRITIDIDTTQLPLKTDEVIYGWVVEDLIHPLRNDAIRTLQALKAQSLTEEQQAKEMKEPLAQLMVALMLEANLTVEDAPSGTTVTAELPFERR